MKRRRAIFNILGLCAFIIMAILFLSNIYTPKTDQKECTFSEMPLSLQHVITDVIGNDVSISDIKYLHLNYIDGQSLFCLFKSNDFLNTRHEKTILVYSTCRDAPLNSSNISIKELKDIPKNAPPWFISSVEKLSSFERYMPQKNNFTSSAIFIDLNRMEILLWINFNNKESFSSGKSGGESGITPPQSGIYCKIDKDK